MKKLKKILLSLGPISLIAIIPMIAIACSSDSSNNDDTEMINKALNSALETNSHLTLTVKGKNTLPSDINVNKINDYINLPNSTQISGYTIDFEFESISNLNNDDGSVLVSLLATTKSSVIRQNKLITLFGFQKQSDTEDMKTALELIKNVPNITKITTLGSTVLPSSIELSNINNYIEINNTIVGAKYSITSIFSPNNVLGTLAITVELNYKGIILTNEYTVSGFKQENVSEDHPDTLDKLVNQSGEIIDPNTGISTNLITTGYKALIEEMDLNQNSQINSNLIENINATISDTQDFSNIKVAVANDTSNIKGQLVLTISGTYNNETINNGIVTITGFNKSILANDFNNYSYSINNFELNTSNYLNDFQTESSLKSFTTYLQWQRYIQKLVVKRQNSSINNISLLQYFNNEGVTRDIKINYTGGTNISFSFEILNSSFSNDKWDSNWIKINTITNSNNIAFLPTKDIILNHFIKTITVNPNYSFNITPSTVYWNLKADADTFLRKLLSLNHQVETVYFPDGYLSFSASNVNSSEFDDENGQASINFELTNTDSSSTSAIRTIEINGFKTFNDIFPLDKQNNTNNIVQISSAGSIWTKLKNSLKAEINKGTTISTDKNHPTEMNVSYQLIPGPSSGSANSYLVISEGNLRWSQENLNNFGGFLFLGQNFQDAWNNNLHTYGTKGNVIGINNLQIEWTPNKISVYKSNNNSYEIFTNLKFDFSDFGINKQIDVYYFATVFQSDL